MEEKITRFLQQKVGTNIYINKLEKIKGTNDVSVNVGVSLPRMIYDDLNEKQYLRFVKFDNVMSFTANIKPSGEIDAEISLKKLFEIVSKKEERLNYQIEEIILDKVSLQLIDIPLIQTFLRPIYTILNQTFHKKEFTEKMISSYPNKERLEKYLSFLKNLDIIRKGSDGGYRRGNIPIELEAAIEKKDETEVLKHVFGYIVKKGRKYIKEELNLPIIEAFLRIIAVYYSSALGVNKIIFMDDDTYYDELTYQHPKYRPHPAKFLNHLESLSDAGILVRKGNLFSGNDKTLKELKEEIPNLTLTPRIN